MPVPITAILRFGDDWRSTQRVLNTLATPVGWRYCQPARYKKNRALSEAWVEIRDKWVVVLRQIDAAISAESLPWDNGRPYYNRGFHQTYRWRAPDGLYHITLSDGKNKFAWSNWLERHIIVRWDAVTESFEIM